MVSWVFSRSISHPPIITREMGRNTWVLPHTTLANRWTKSKLGSRISGFTISWVPYCATGQRARATMPTSRIWHRRSFHHSVWIIFHILDTSSNALALVDQRTTASAPVTRNAWAVVTK